VPVVRCSKVNCVVSVHNIHCIYYIQGCCSGYSANAVVGAETFMLFVDRAIEEYWKLLASTSAVKVGNVERSVQVFSVIAIHCNDCG